MSGVCVLSGVSRTSFLKEGCPATDIEHILYGFAVYAGLRGYLASLGGFAENMSRNPRAPRCVLRAGSEIRVRACAVAAAARERWRLKK